MSPTKASHHDHEHLLEGQHYAQRHNRKRTVLLLGAIVVFAIASLTLLSSVPGASRTVHQLWTNHSSPDSNDNHAPGDGDGLGIPLYPLEHSNREPVTIHQHWRITSDFRRPDGVLKRVYLINNKTAPTIEARSGDRLVIEVENALLDDEGTAIHWHGLFMHGQNAMDGAVGITQSPIQLGQTFAYDFNISLEQYGTYWYHAHDQTQRADGLLGGLVIHKPADTADHEEATDEQLLLIGDWYHRSGKDILTTYMSSGSFGNEPVPDSLLVNHGGAYHCSDAVPARPLDCIQVAPLALRFNHDEAVRLRIVNTGSLAAITIRATGLVMTPVAVDGNVAIAGTPATSVGTLWPGQRVDVLVYPQDLEAGSSPELKVEIDSENFKYPNSALSLVHTFPVHYRSQTSTKASPPPEEEPIDHFDLQAATHASPQPSPLAPTADTTLVLYTMTQKLASLSNVPHGFINHTTWSPQTPSLNTLPRSQWDKHQLVPFIPYNATNPLTVDIVLNNLDEDSHPFHLHGYSFWVLASFSSTYGWGSWNPYEAASPPGGELELMTSVKRDTVYVPRRGYVVLRFVADNPGIWMLHCHVLWHQASGMAMGIAVGEMEDW